jgi:hypothetical protein
MKRIVTGMLAAAVAAFPFTVEGGMPLHWMSDRVFAADLSPQNELGLAADDGLRGAWSLASIPEIAALSWQRIPLAAPPRDDSRGGEPRGEPTDPAGLSGEVPLAPSRETPWDEWENRESTWNDWDYRDPPWAD